jgi:hypothetical protein
MVYLNLGYAYPWGYTKSWQGVRQSILKKVNSKKAIFMNIKKTSLNVKKGKLIYKNLIKRFFIKKHVTFTFYLYSGHCLMGSLWARP